MKRPIATLILVLLAGAAWQVLSADVTKAQDDSQTPGDAEPAANDGEPTEADIRDLLVKESMAGFRKRWGRRQLYLRMQKCEEDSSGYVRRGGPTVICNPDDVTPEMIQEHRKQLEHLGSTFLNERTPKF